MAVLFKVDKVRKTTAVSTRTIEPTWLRYAYALQTSPDEGDDDAVAPQVLTDDQIVGAMGACATGDVHELEKYVTRYVLWGLAAAIYTSQMSAGETVQVGEPNSTKSADKTQQESRAVARKQRYTATVLYGLSFVDNIHYKFKSSQASKVRLHSSEHAGAKQNLTQNGYSRSFKVTCFGKAIRD